MLDVGCGDHSPTLTKRWLRDVVYHGVDRAVYNNDERDLAAMDRSFTLDLAEAELDEIPDGEYDAVVFCHVIEHLPNGLDVLAALCGKLAPGGVIYVEFPSPRSLWLPSARGTLNFWDDPTHVRVYDRDEIARVLVERGVEVLARGRSRDHLKAMVGLATLPLQALAWLRFGKLDGRWGLADLTGFAEYVYGRKPDPSSR